MVEQGHFPVPKDICGYKERKPRPAERIDYRWILLLWYHLDQQETIGRHASENKVLTTKSNIKDFMDPACNTLDENQLFVTAGGFHDVDANIIAGSWGDHHVWTLPLLASGNHEEAEARVWLHQCSARIIDSPDTIIIGLIPVDNEDMVVHADTPGASDHLYVNIKLLKDLIKWDPNMTHIPAQVHVSMSYLGVTTLSSSLCSVCGVEKTTFLG